MGSVGHRERIGGAEKASRHEPQALLVDGRPVGTVEVASGFRERSRGLLGRDGIDGALVLEPAMSIHTFGMRFALDVAFCDRKRRVIAVREMRPWRLTRPRFRCRSVLEAQSGSFAEWSLVAGSVLSLAPVEIDGHPVGAGPLPRSDLL